MNARQRFEEMIQALRANPLVEVETATLGPATDPALVEELRRTRGADIPAAVFDFYAEVGSLELVWWAKLPEANRSDMGWSGRIKLVPLAAVVDADEWRDLLWFDFHEETHPFRRIRPIDFWVEEACAVLYPVPGDAQVCFHYCGEELVPTGLSFEQWVDRLLASRGFWYWITACTSRASGEAQRFFEVMPKLFADFDASLFVASEEPPVDTY